MVCKKCGRELIGFFSEVCPFCGTDNHVSLFDAIFSDPPENKKTKDEKKKKKFDPYDWDDPNNCSDREYMDNDDYDDFDH